VAIVPLVAAKGSAGVTTAALTLAAVWPEGRGAPLVVECDPGGGDVAARFGLGVIPGVVSLAAELERSDYAVSSNIGRTLSACRQAVVDVRCCVDWLEEQGYEHFGVLGTSLGSCYAFLASAHDPRIRVNAFNHASTAFGDVTWAGQSTRHVKQALGDAGLTQERVRALWAAASPCYYYDKIAAAAAGGPGKRVLLVYADYDLTFPREYSLQVVDAFRGIGLNFEPRVLPCGHYTTGESPYKFLDGWYLGWFVYRAFKALRQEKAAGLRAAAVPAHEAEEEAVTR